MKRDYYWWIDELYWAIPARPVPSWVSHLRYYAKRIKWAIVRWAIVPNAEGTLCGYNSHIKVEGWIF